MEENRAINRENEKQNIAEEGAAQSSKQMTLRRPLLKIFYRHIHFFNLILQNFSKP